MITWDVTLLIGPDEKYASLSDALDHIPEEAHRVLILVSHDLTQDVESYIPTDRNIQYLKIASSDSTSKIINFTGCSFFANGIPLEIDSTITMKDCFLFGGSQADAGQPVVIQSSKIIINGSADYVYGSGYAIGSGSVSTVHDVLLIIDGQVSHLYGGGYAVQSGTVYSGSIHIQINRNGLVDRVLNGGNCLVGPDCHSIIRKININIIGRITGNISLGGYASYNSSTSVHDEINLQAKEAELSGAIYDGIKLDEKSVITIRKVTGSISSGQQELLELPEHKIQIIQSENASGPFETQNDPNEHNHDDSYHALDTADSGICAEEQSEIERTEITSNEIFSENCELQSVPDSDSDTDGEIQQISDNEEPGNSMADTTPADDTENDNSDVSPESIPSADQLTADDTKQNNSSEIIQSSDGEDMNSNPDQTSPVNTSEEAEPDENTKIIPDSISSVDNHPQTNTEPDKLCPEINNLSQTEANYPYSEKGNKYKPVNDNSRQDEKTGRKRLFSIIGVVVIFAALLIIYFLFPRKKTNNQFEPTEYISTEAITNNDTAKLPAVQITSAEELPALLENSITPNAVILSAAGNKDDSVISIISVHSVSTETVKPEIVFTPSVTVSTSMNTLVQNIATAIPSATLKPTMTRAINSPTANAELLIRTETISATPTVSDTLVTASATPRPTYTKTVPSYTPTVLEITTEPTAVTTVTSPIIQGNTSTPQLSDTYDKSYQDEEMSVTQEESPRLASIHSATDSGTYFYQRPYQSQEYVLRWLNNGIEIKIINGPVIRNNAEWYEVFCEKYDLSGWVVSNAVVEIEN